MYNIDLKKHKYFPISRQGRWIEKILESLSTDVSEPRTSTELETSPF